MRIYLAGPMTGKRYFNYFSFNATAEALTALGHEVFNPVSNDVARYGTGLFLDNPKGDPDIAKAHYTFDRRLALTEDIEYICKRAEAVFLLPGWAESRGAIAEVAVAQALDIPTYFKLEDVPNVAH